MVVVCSALKHHAVRKQSLGALSAREPPGWVGGIHVWSLSIVALPEGLCSPSQLYLQRPSIACLGDGLLSAPGIRPWRLHGDEARSSQPSAANLISARFVATPAAHISQRRNGGGFAARDG